VIARLGLRPCHRLRQKADFDRVYRHGARAGDGFFAVNALPNELGHARFGMSVSIKTCGKAVNRNRVRRLIREHFRLHRPELPAVDFVITSRPGAREATAADLRASLERLMKLAAKRAATDTPRSNSNGDTGRGA
jgi:ribonuclease P protein component